MAIVLQEYKECPTYWDGTQPFEEVCSLSGDAPEMLYESWLELAMKECHGGIVFVGNAAKL